MIGVIYLGHNPQTEEKLRYLPGEKFIFTPSYIEAADACKKTSAKEHFIIFYERSVYAEDITAITYLKKSCPSIYLILMTDKMSEDERKMYQKCGINDTIDIHASVIDLKKKLQFISDRENLLFDTNVSKQKILRFQIPLWKRIFDIVFSLLALIVLSPIMLFTIIAIKIESPGPALFKSKRVGTNYKVFDFLKFRSMYVDAEKRLKELSKTGNQYADHTTDIKDIASQNTADDVYGLGGDTEMMISDDEVMLVGDDFVVAESDFSKQKEEENNNAFVKIENDPRVTKVGRFIRKWSIDELPQLINILKGDMSIVGNRPLPLYEAEKLTVDSSIDRFMAPAGLTGLWQVEERGKGGSMSAEERKQLDIKYGQTYNLWLDLKIIFRTLFAFVQKENV